ncbi:EamA domain-containing protein [Cephalotus follicularis]|nr:EamA domain-containing protein [Cephalotus follicularis]
MEELDWRRSTTVAKSVGTVVSIAGAFIVTLYKGHPLIMKNSESDVFHEQSLSQQSNWFIGGLFLAADCLLSSAWLIVQASILKNFPVELIVVFYYVFFVAIQSAAVCLVMERNISAWSLKPDARLISVLYSAVFGSAVQVGISTWCLQRTGPVFVAMFKPLGIVIAVAVGVIFFGDTFYLGNLVGAVVIVIGFYLVMWGKAKENMGIDVRLENSDSSSQNVSLLQDKMIETEKFLQ